MNLRKLLFIPIVVFSFCSLSLSQTKRELPGYQNGRSTPAYAEVLLRKTELESEVESLLVSYTEDFPKLKEARFELNLLDKDLARILSETDPAKLTIALGKLLVRKNELETDSWALLNKYGKDHPEVKRSQKKAAIFQKAIKEILP